MSHAFWIGLLAAIGAGAIRGRVAAGAASGLFLSGTALVVLGGVAFLSGNERLASAITLALTAAVLLGLGFAPGGDVRIAAWRREIGVVCGAGLIVVLWRSAAFRSLERWLGGFDAVAPASVFAFGALACLTMLTPSFFRWRTRARVWIEAPERLVEPRPNLAPLCAAVTLVALAAGVLSLRRLGAPGTAPGLGLAAWAAFSAAYASGWRFPAEAGFWLLSLAIATTIAAMHGEKLALGGGDMPNLPAAVAAAALSGLLLLGLARSWAQLVRDGRVLTLAGRLVGSARRAAAACAVVVAMWLAISAPPPGTDARSAVSAWGVAAAVLAALWTVATVRISVDSDTLAGRGGASLLVAGVAVFTAGTVLGGAPFNEPMFWVSLSASGWVVLLLTLGRERVCGWACQAYIWGLLPVVGYGAALDGGLNRHDAAAMLLMVAAALASCLAREREGEGRPAAETRPSETMTTG